MDSRLRALKRAIVDDETAARFVAACVQAGENTRERVKIAACLGNPVALLLEPEPYPESYMKMSKNFERYYWIEQSIKLLTIEERAKAIARVSQKLSYRLEDAHIHTMLHEVYNLSNSDTIADFFSAFRSFGVTSSPTYDSEVDAECEILSHILLQLPEEA